MGENVNLFWSTNKLISIQRERITKIIQEIKKLNKLVKLLTGQVKLFLVKYKFIQHGRYLEPWHQD